MRITLLALVGALASLTACDSTVEPPTGTPPEARPEVPTAAEANLSPRVFNVILDAESRVKQPRLVSFQDSSEVAVLAAGGLWLAGRQSGSLRAAAARHLSTYGPCAGLPDAVFRVDGDATYSAAGWPAEAGAPTTADGAPRAYGDEMAWTTVCSQPSDGLQPFTDVRVNAAVFGVDERENVVFMRYEIRNESAAAIADAYAGFWADPDLEVEGTLVLDNLIGFDAEAEVGYVYVAPGRTGANPGVYSDRQRGHVAGLVVLESPGDAPLAAYRIMDKRGGPYGEGGLTSGEALTFALRGLTNDGGPMVNPVTDQPTTFAYTGDPVAMTGWLDGFDNCGTSCTDGAQVGEELRQLTSVGPFQLGAGETTVFTVAYVYQSGADLAAGLARLRDDAAALRAQPSLWRFAPTN